MRKLASIQRIQEVKDIENSDFLYHYRINNWWVVGKKDEFQVSDLVIYFEIDSWIPSSLAPFLSKGKEPRTFNGVQGERLRTIKLRGALSQGLILAYPNEGYPPTSDEDEGTDLTEILNIQKYEKPVPTQLAGMMKGNFPSFIPKTDQERIQNFTSKQYSELQDMNFEVSEKLDGSSMTVYYNDGEWGVCSRNVDLKLDQEGNSFVEMYKSLQEIFEHIRLHTKIENIAFQGELIGGKIQGNAYKIDGYHFYMYNIFDIDTQTYLKPQDAFDYTDGYQHARFDYVPLVRFRTSLKALGVTDIDSLLNYAEGKSLLNKDTGREGIVFKACDGSTSFKVISNKWLLKNE